MRQMIAFVDGTHRSLVASPLSRQPGTLDPFYTGEKIILDVVPLREVESAFSPAWELDPSYASASFKVGLGALDLPAQGGSYTLTYDGDETSAIDYNSPAITVSAAINALASVISDGGYDVFGDYISGYILVRKTAGTNANSFALTKNNLRPDSTVVFLTKKAGASGIHEVLLLRIVQDLGCLTTSASAAYGTGKYASYALGSHFTAEGLLLAAGDTLEINVTADGSGSSPSQGLAVHLYGTLLEERGSGG